MGAVAVLAAATLAAWGPPATDEGKLARYLPVARAAWPGSVCAGRETIHLRGDAEMAARGFPRDAYAGAADYTRCEVWMRSRLDAQTFCTALVHELGHLARQSTDHDEAGVMAPHPAMWPACRLSGREAAGEEVGRMWPATRYRRACTPWHGRTRRCRFTGPRGGTTRVLVTAWRWTFQLSAI